MTFSTNDDGAKRELSTGELEAVAAGFSLPLFGGHGPVVLPPRRLFGGHGPVVSVVVSPSHFPFPGYIH